jgi:hypothetical protein
VWTLNKCDTVVGVVQIEILRHGIPHFLRLCPDHRQLPQHGGAIDLLMSVFSNRPRFI